MTSILFIPLLVYPGISIYAYFFADRLIFQPQFSTYQDDETIIKLTTSGGEKISARFYKNPRATHTILFCHGNADDLGTVDSMLKALRENGFAVLSFDYRGYGTSEGRPGEENVYRDVEAAYEYLISRQQIVPEKIIVMGRSLGGGVAIDLAARKKVGALVVESSFVSAFRVLTKYQILPFDEFQNLKKIKAVNCPILFIHGWKDRIIPLWHSEKLLAEANEPKFHLWLDEAGHNNVFQTGGNIYLQTIRDFADQLPQ